jgi:hypothetical protein
VLGIIERAGVRRRTPAAEEVIAVVRDFEKVKFEVPDSRDSDGFMFQYGKVNWLPDPTFILGFVRQLEIVDADGEHEAYSQIQLEYRYSIDADLDLLKNHSSWWFPESHFSFGEWLESMQQDSVWEVVREKRASGFDVSQELV